jgi:hypothetical protein
VTTRVSLLGTRIQVVTVGFFIYNEFTTGRPLSGNQ